MHYLDNAATTAVAPEVVRLVAEVLEKHYANPASLYAPGMYAQQCIEEARQALAAALGCGEGEVVFTGSGTESNNIALLGAARARKGWGNHIITCAYEHPSVLKPMQALAEREGFRLTMLSPAQDGRMDMDAYLAEITPKTVLVAAMQVNNETGAAIDVEALAAATKAKNPRTAVHVDGIQGFTKLPPLHLPGSGIDTYAISGHKLHAPKGVGALYVRKGFNLQPPFEGGGQERGVRPGTENTAYIAGLGRAVELAAAGRAAADKTVAALHAQLLAGLAGLAGIEMNSPPDAYKGIVNFSLPGVRSETMLHYLEGCGVYVSSGSACSKGSPSQTLSAMRLPAGRVDCALRVSFDGGNTPQDIDALLEGLAQGLATLARPGG